MTKIDDVRVLRTFVRKYTLSHVRSTLSWEKQTGGVPDNGLKKRMVFGLLHPDTKGLSNVPKMKVVRLNHQPNPLSFWVIACTKARHSLTT